LDWSRIEVEAIVADYLQMLTLELSGQSFSKTEHRRRLIPLLDNRSDGSIEFKHGNISAVMLEMGIPYIRGYKPRSNFQALLVGVVAEQVRNRPSLDQAALAAVQQPAIAPIAGDFVKVITHAPALQSRLSESMPPHAFNAVKKDYLAREAENRSLGLAGEEFVTQYEHWRLVQLGQRVLADRVEHVSNTRGDGLGYDVLSFEPDGQEKYIEVKTTTFGKETPFFVSRNEIAFSKAEKERFHLYRLFEFRKTPRLFDLPGQLDQHCILDAVTFKASFC
jgi:Domain of unknown function (DUF3883)